MKKIIFISIICALLASGGTYCFMRNLDYSFQEKNEEALENEQECLDENVSMVKVPIASRNLTALTNVSNADVSFVEVPSSFLANNSNIIQNVSNLLDSSNPYCVYYDTNILKGSFFYQDAIINCKTNFLLKDLPDGYLPFILSVNETSNFSFFPGEYIDLEVELPLDDKYIHELFITNLPIIAVRDKDGNYITDSSDTRVPKEIMVGVLESDSNGNNMYLLLSEMQYISNLTFIAIPNDYSVGNETKLTSYYLKRILENMTISIPVEVN